MKFSESTSQENNFTPKQVYLGKAAYKIVAVNPTNEQLKALGQYTTDDEPVYVFKREVGGSEYNAVNITVYLQNPSDATIIDRVIYTIVDNVQESQTGKMAAINKYGAGAWIEASHIKAKTLPESLEKWYVNEGVKECRRGEEQLVNFIRALRNFKKISITSTQEDKDNYVSQFEEDDIKKLMKGDFSDIRSILMSNPDSKVGFLLGAKSTDSGKVYQDIYKEYPMRPYMVGNDGSNEYIIKVVKEAQDNGKYANTYFDLVNLNHKKYDPENVDMPVPDTEEDHDDLPF